MFTHDAVPEISICLVAVAEVDEGAVAGGDAVLVVPDTLLAVRRVLEHGANVLGRVGEGALGEAALRPGAVAAEASFGVPHIRAKEVAGISVLLLIPPWHGTSVVALVAHQSLEGVHHHAVPWEELADVVDDVAVDGIRVGPVGSLEVAEARGLRKSTSAGSFSYSRENNMTYNCLKAGLGREPDETLLSLDVRGLLLGAERAPLSPDSYCVSSA